MQQTSGAGRAAWQGVTYGLAPLAQVVVGLALTLGLTLAARQLSAGQGFFTQQLAAVIPLVIGLVVTAGVYALACVRTLRRAGAWRVAGSGAQATAALWTLGVTAVVMVAPMVLAIVLPQHAAP